ncbi:Srpk [Penicillium cosmopolitanum]|uniref:Srpk n=1 Tax=Penicillium cosmopolitanum TaxID=1131564 RepID=A0A9W9W358_9EURO|nr:Srpk [Penicillium cosmopolitanum]KAJ5397720.1 Srpk [Penicillium cosmopolitanum]
MMLPSILDRFTLNGLNGNHACYVTAPVSASLSDLKDGSWIRLFQPDVARSLAAQLMLALDYVHAQGIVHGDMYLGNILLKVPLNFDQLSPERLHEKYGAPELEPVSRLNGKPLPPGVPTHGVPPIWLGKASEEIVLLETRILLADFGEAFILFILSKERKFESCTPLVIRPPEARFEPNEPLSFSSDIWTLTCTIWTIIGQRQLLEGFLATEDDMTCEHVCQDTLSILPLDWWEKWDALRQKFDGDGEPRNRKSFRSWDDRFEDSVQQPRQDSGISPFNEKEEALFNVLRLMLSFRPANRPTTNQILKSEWMVKLALPEYRKSQNNI